MCASNETNINPNREKFACRKLFWNRRTAAILFLGSPLIDVTARVNDAFLQKYSLQPDNAYSVDEDKEAIFEEIGNKGATVKVGGSVTNTVRTFRKLRGSPENTAYLGSIGDDHYGRLIKRQLEEEGIASGLVEISGESTGKVAVLLQGKARTLVTDLGASRVFALTDTALKTFRQADLVYFSAFFIGVSFKTLKEIIETNHNKIIAFNLGAPFLSKKYPTELTYIYQNSNLVFGNEAEHRAFASIHNIADPNLTTVAMETNKKHSNARVIVITRGERPVLVVDGGESEEFEVENFDRNKMVDSNGAGDFFVGGFLARYVEGDSIANCVRCGIHAAHDMLLNGL